MNSSLYPIFTPETLCVEFNIEHNVELNTEVSIYRLYINYSVKYAGGVIYILFSLAASSIL